MYCTYARNQQPRRRHDVSSYGGHEQNSMTIILPSHYLSICERNISGGWKSTEAHLKEVASRKSAVGKGDKADGLALTFCHAS